MWSTGIASVNNSLWKTGLILLFYFLKTTLSNYDDVQSSLESEVSSFTVDQTYFSNSICYHGYHLFIVNCFKSGKQLIFCKVLKSFFSNFPNARVSEKFSKCVGFWEIPNISSHLRNFQSFINVPLQNSYRNLENFGNFPIAWVSGKFLKCLGIWEVSQIPKIPVGIWWWCIWNILEISQIPGYMGNFPNAWVFGKFPKYSVTWEISEILKIYHPQNHMGI